MRPRPDGWPRHYPIPPEREEDLPFQRCPMVDWLSPGELTRTGIKAAISSVFGAYADQREVQAALHPLPQNPEQPIHDANYEVGEKEDFWFDYCADLGDGFDSTYAMALLMSRRELAVQGCETPLPRGRFLVMGGDQVYPTAGRDAYRDHFVGPYRAALPGEDPELAPDLFAVPGNHDWYDGLTSFTRLFCQSREKEGFRWIGGWRTRQHRSYFALRLPRGWWLWGTDIQLGTDIDLPQLQFFRRAAEEMQKEASAAAKRPRLILCTPRPTWVYCDAEEPGARTPPRGGCRHPVDPAEFDALAFFEREVVKAHDLDLALVVSGDLHHYLRYREEVVEGEDGPVGTPTQRITSGGGGAYLYPTHHMPERLALPVHRQRDPGDTVPFTREGAFPTSKDSRRFQLRGWLALPWRNFGFAVVVAAIYLLYAWMLQSASRAENGPFTGLGLRCDSSHSLLDVLACCGLGDLGTVFRVYWAVLRHSPSGIVFSLAIVLGLWKYRQSGGSSRYGLGGVVHGVAHLLLACGLIWLFARVNLVWLPGLFGFGPSVDSFPQIVAFVLEMLLAGGLLGGWLFGLYLRLTSKVSGGHINDLFSAQYLPDFKNFLRLRIDRDGRLHIYPIGVRAVPRGAEWSYSGGRPLAGSPEAKENPGKRPLAPGAPWFEPPPTWLDAEAGRTPAELVDGPITLG